MSVITFLLSLQVFINIDRSGSPEPDLQTHSETVAVVAGGWLALTEPDSAVCSLSFRADSEFRKRRNERGVVALTLSHVDERQDKR